MEIELKVKSNDRQTSAKSRHGRSEVHRAKIGLEETGVRTSAIRAVRPHVAYQLRAKTVWEYNGLASWRRGRNTPRRKLARDAVTLKSDASQLGERSRSLRGALHEFRFP